MKRLACGSIVLVLVACGWGAHSIGQEVPTPRGELRVVDKNPTNWAWVTFNVFEHLARLIHPPIFVKVIGPKKEDTRLLSGSRRTFFS
jgi:hypothetical protein